ncbi:MAG: nuclear transport factor 2 family protein [Leptolyngbyaceae cyanobacterium bins.302]|nr:nuclear transport factor 2 family protein [Leptolyngbyaceae cyanobacterium bins.302]
MHHDWRKVCGYNFAQLRGFMNKQNSTQISIPRRKFLIGSGFMVAAIAPSAVAVQRKQAAPTTEEFDEDKNKEIIRAGFARWADGTGSFFGLLADDVEWTITGRSPISKTYTSREKFLEEAIAPLNDRLSVGIVPRVRGIYAEGDMVIALWDGTATAKDGKPYGNTYSWYMTMRNGRIVKVVAFFDTIELTELWRRIPVT